MSSARVRQASASTVRRCVGESSSVGVSGSGGHSSVARACFSLANHRRPAGPRARLCLVSSSFCDFSIFRSRAAERKWNRSRVSSSCFCGRMRVGETLTCCLRHVCVKHQRPPSDDGSESRVLLECRAVAGIPPWPELAFLSRIVRAARGACDSRRGFLFSIPLDRAHHFFISLLGSRLYSYRFSPHAIKTFW